MTSDGVRANPHGDRVRAYLDGITERLAKLRQDVWDDVNSELTLATGYDQSNDDSLDWLRTTTDLIVRHIDPLAGAVGAVLALAEKWHGWSLDDPSGFPAGYRAAAPFASELYDTVAAHLDPGATT